MGLDISHDAWHGAYSAFMRWRQEIAKAAGFPPLCLMEGFYDGEGHNPFSLLEYAHPNPDELSMFQLREIKKELPIKWESLAKNPLITLINHSDCDGEIDFNDLNGICDELTKLLDKLPENGGGHIGSYKEKTQAFIDGAMNAYHAKQNLIFR